MKLEPVSMENKIPFHLMNQNLLQSQDNKAKYDQIYDDEFVSLINRLNESIKEYFKVSKNNITDANSVISFYEDQGKSIQELFEQLMNENASVGINDIVEQFSKINDIMNQLQINILSSDKNLNLFFDDAKILFKKMKMKRKQKIIELINNSIDANTNINSNKKYILNDSYSNSFNKIKSNFLKKNKVLQEQMSYKKINFDNKSTRPNTRFLLSISNIYLKINRLINQFSEFDNLINKINNEAFNKYKNLQNSIKKELDILMNLIKNNDNNIRINNVISDDLNRRSQSIPNSISKEFENLKQIRQINEKKIEQLNYELNNYKINMKNLKNLNNISADLNSDYEAKIRELQINNNNLTINLMKAEQLIKDKDSLILSYQSNLKKVNNNNNINNILNSEDSENLKDPQIMQLQQQISIYKNNENLLNEQIANLNNKIQTKINEYESKISLNNDKNSSLSRIIIKKNKDVQRLQNENNKYKIEIQQLKNAINSQIPIEYQNEIERLTNEINNYQNMIYQYENKINELSQNKSMNLNNNINNDNANLDLQKKFEMLNKEMQLKESEYINKNVKNVKTIEELKKKLAQLNKEILNYQKKEKYYEDNNNKYIKQIEDMNNDILHTNNILEQKDDLIKKLNEKKSDQIPNNNINLILQKEKNEYQFQLEQLQKKYIAVKELLEEKNSNNNINDNNNNDNLKMKLIDIQLENEKLRKQIEELSTSLKNNNNNNIYGNEVLLKDNIISGNGNNNNDLINKIKELNLENQKYKENISKLENDINKKNEELEGFKNVIFKQQNQLEKKDDEFQKQKDELIRNISSLSILGNEGKIINTEPNRSKSNMKQNQNKSFEAQKDSNAVVINNLLNKLKDADRKINSLKDKNKELKYKLEDKQAERELSGYRTEDINFSNYEEEFDLKRMVNGARDKNRSEDINIDYPGIQILKDKYREVIQNMSMLEEQVKILLCNISCNNKIKPQITQICQLMRIPAKNIQLVIAGKDKRRALGLIS